jgi:hypothetical protein
MEKNGLVNFIVRADHVGMSKQTFKTYELLLAKLLSKGKVWIAPLEEIDKWR